MPKYPTGKNPTDTQSDEPSSETYDSISDDNGRSPTSREHNPSPDITESIKDLLSSVTKFKEKLLSTEEHPTPNSNVTHYAVHYDNLEIALTVENMYTNIDQTKRRIKVNHLWLAPQLRGNGYATTIIEAVEEIRQHHENIEQIKFKIQVEGDEPEQFRHWGYTIKGPYPSEYENEVIYAKKTLS